MRTGPSQTASPTWSPGGMILVSGEQMLHPAHSSWWKPLTQHTPFPDPILCYSQSHIRPSRNQNLLWFTAIIMGSAWEKKNGTELLCKYRMKHNFYVKFDWSYKNWPVFFLWLIFCWRNCHFYLRTREVSVCSMHKFICFQKTWEMALPNWMAFISQWVSFKV